jgi:hypothetical protein
MFCHLWNKRIPLQSRRPGRWSRYRGRPETAAPTSHHPAASPCRGAPPWAPAMSRSIRSKRSCSRFPSRKNWPSSTAQITSSTASWTPSHKPSRSISKAVCPLGPPQRAGPAEGLFSTIDRFFLLFAFWARIYCFKGRKAISLFLCQKASSYATAKSDDALRGCLKSPRRGQIQ